MDQCSEDQCPGCGIIFSKWMKHQYSRKKGIYSDKNITDKNLFLRIKDTLLYVNPGIDSAWFYTNIMIFIIFFFWGWQFILMDYSLYPNQIMNSFMHNINLVFHEAGHVFFKPFGRFMMILGGSLMQLLVPIVLMLGFILKNHDNFSASICLWWLGQSLMDLAPYIDDAMDQQLMLLGGKTGADSPGSHDWNNILIEFDVLEKCHAYAKLTDMAGTLVMLLAFAWGIIILLKQYRQIKS
ncbi:MAG: hypothetical protein GWO08_13125 [Gammaproteobacteria bacterium]|nr:hypothetical protein [Gammaproteobacteria bacterium]NIN60891.1 hypothetical protein [Gammaproteobacteria bacterium]NIP49567.1 hypothetical protein [Gammaproteobacteria bacterium]NIQ10791.1 hypothetical protein [Gammaproteobacteria bacterium]NIQ76365.1 hypothetical protein [Gammaproteobacteria bacterium]